MPFTITLPRNGELVIIRPDIMGAAAIGLRVDGQVRMFDEATLRQLAQQYQQTSGNNPVIRDDATLNDQATKGLALAMGVPLAAIESGGAMPEYREFLQALQGLQRANLTDAQTANISSAGGLTIEELTTAQANQGAVQQQTPETRTFQTPDQPAAPGLSVFGQQPSAQAPTPAAPAPAPAGTIDWNNPNAPAGWGVDSSGHPVPPSSPQAPAVSGAPPTTGAPQYGEYVPDPSFLQFYGEDEIARAPGGKIYLKPGVPVRWSAAPTTTPPAAPGAIQEVPGSPTISPSAAQEVVAPTQSPQGATVDPIVGQLTGEFQALYEQLSGYVERLEAKGQQINPNIEITPQQIAEFTKQAEEEINPFYKQQLKAVRDDFLRSVGFSAEEVVLQEADLERRYGRNLRAIGESKAEQGFALSGLREREQEDLATDTQRQIEDTRRRFAFGTEGGARSLAQQFGTEAVPEVFLPGSPRVIGGEASFVRANRQLPIFQLSSDVFDGLVGSEEFERRAAVKRRTAELESTERERQVLNQERQLVL